ncbi:MULTISPECIES: YcnI family protein [unclassified Solwaraspora]|uniref:YcnI family copper-binding membrane protein n=1 Tax=unclassified Solwaraspora TaxID=2627926 RepID=UPI00248B9AA1|nr:MULTISPECIES: YcnI family protein [unclassified Solwaraspora]WBB98225.1 YcnI family protein [Solwaraspora sp. WMMA2059]WBC23221.1 YcnI family protein [Solwaraspora sp. WMMA2080]WJK34704.1 YcnI family protein [Solwaraspora sp. WMMA2065]
MLRHRRTPVRVAALAGAAAVVGILGLAAPAAAHITVHPTQAPSGDYARLDFQVPNESDEHSTVKVEVVMPEDTPIASVSLARVPGWTVEVQTAPVDPPLEVHGAQVTEAVSRVVWTAETAEASVQPGEFLDLPIRMGPLPDAEQLVFKSLQTYSDGTVVRWIEVPVPGEEEPATPASVLTLTSAEQDSPAVGGGQEPVDDEAPADDAATGSDTGGSGAALGVGIVGLLAGLGGLVLGGLAFARTRRPTPAPAAAPAAATRPESTSGDGGSAD